MKKRSIIVLFAFILFSSLGVIAQEKLLKKADKKYKNLAYVDAAKIYLNIINSGYKSTEVLIKLGNSYYYNSNYTEAVKWYEELYNFKEKTEDQNYLLRYSQSLKSVKNNSKAEKIYNEFLVSSRLLNTGFKNAKDYLDIIELNSNLFDVKILDINSSFIDYGAFYKNDTLYFTSSRNREKAKIDIWNNDRFLDIYTTSYDSITNRYSEPESLKGNINSKFHESSAIITKDGNTMYFTRSNNLRANRKNKKLPTLLKIYRATKKNGNWENIEDLSINGNLYSTSHPVLSPDEKTLYYASDMPEAYGETDIYSVAILDDGNLGKPSNMGLKVNTLGRESFPFISLDNKLYFSSDGHFGLGGYDVFYIDLSIEKAKLLNPGKPFNSAFDDFAFGINSSTKMGFFSSNRSGVDNIYTFSKRPIKNIDLKGFVTDKRTKELLTKAVITIKDRKGNIEATTSTNSLGEFNIRIRKLKSFIVIAEKEQYVTADIFIPVGKNKEVVHLELDKTPIQINKGVDIAKLLNISIYYDFDKSDIKKEALVELEKIVAFMRKFPKVHLYIKSHTDNIGKASYNLKLSERRARRIFEFLVSRGIMAYKLKTKGFGELELQINCNDKECTDEENQLNRRTEFVVIQK
jgi:outer membrane protein OmpA-like peptidoglycan-associated protein/tetratricopeptide (TPR) repeat protein